MNFEFPVQAFAAARRAGGIERCRVRLGGSACRGAAVEPGHARGQLRRDDGPRLGEETARSRPGATAGTARHTALVTGGAMPMGRPCDSPSAAADDLVDGEITGPGRPGVTVAAVASPSASALGVAHAAIDTPEVRRVALGFDERVPERWRVNRRPARGARR